MVLITTQNPDAVSDYQGILAYAGSSRGNVLEP